jgi:hypothetical protein
MKEHNFDHSLTMSQSHSSAPWWQQVYREAFPTMFSMRLVNEDGWAQRAGIDRIIGLADGTHIKIDEKVRTEDWADIALEVWNDWGRLTPGWAHPKKYLTCDFIAYAFIPSATCYLLPYQLLRRVMNRHGNDWWDACKAEESGFRFVDARNRDGSHIWVTRSIAVPIPVLLDAIAGAMVIVWEAH